ncbi:MAG: hypothetical protein HW375_483 [Anaerolineales bacterium]|nr:hypothetical protein [Anaerolineales bacterium]
MSRDPAGLSRRAFLKLGGLAAGAALGPRAPRWAVLAGPEERLCRVTEFEAVLRSRPSPEATAISKVALDDVLVLQREVVGRGVFPHNHVWFETPDGFLWSSEAQPVRRSPNPLVASLPPEGVWTEVTLPFVDGRRSPDQASPVRYRLYYSMVLNVNEVVTGADGAAWYRVEDENAVVMYAPGESFRLITAEEVSPIGSPDREKTIRVNLDRQDLSAIEDLVSGYDLPGVGWTILFSGSGAAVHSTYWHNDFGTPRSNGCINVLPQDAKWLFRWSNPAVAYKPGDVESLFPNPGTPVIVREA